MTCYRALLIICLSLTITILRATDDKIDFENEFVEDYDNDFYNGHSKCDHDHVSHHPEIAEVAEDNYPPHEDGRLLASTTYPQLRIYPYYDILSESAPASYANYIENSLAPSVHSFLQAALKIKYPVSGNLKVSNYQTTLCGVKTPSILFGSGVRADLFIFYDSEYDSASSWVAQSSVCHLASGSNRPLIVTTKFNRALLKDPAGNVLIQEKNVYLLLHEITHNLGFSTSLYPYFLDSNGKRRAGHILSEKLNGINTVVLNTPSLIQRARKYFGCSSLAGVYMENDGAEGTAGSHFERRHFPYEYMASGLIFQQRISQFTLALLEDSGWYVPDYSFAEPYYFGQGEGCGFLFNSCSSLSFKHDEFCAGSGRGCTFQGRGGGICQSDPRSDGCKYYMPNELFDCENPNAANYARLPNIQKFGRTSGSKCFDGSLASTAYSATDTSFCFTYSCQGTENETTVKINVGKMVVTCRRESAVTIPGYYGTVQCPDPLSFCSTVGKGYCPRNCMGRGKCVNNKCVCNNGFKGIDCGLKA